MSEFVPPHQQLPNWSELSATGRGLGVINRKYFESATWEPLLSNEIGRGQYSKFVAAMIERIRVKESSLDEIRSFVHLIATEHNWDFMKLAIPYLPELKEQYPHDSKDFEIALLFLLKPKIRRRGIKVTSNAIPTFHTYKDGLSKTEKEILRSSLFGPVQGGVESPAMSRLFKSTLELGFPQPALDRSVREAKHRGTDIERYPDGLPMNMLMPDADTRPKESSFSSRSSKAGTSEVLIPGISAELSRVPSSPATESNELTDSPPHEFLAEPAVNEEDLPVPTNPIRTGMSHGDPPKLSSIADTEAFVTRQAETPSRPQVPGDDPPRPQSGPAEREALEAHHKEPTSVSSNYFQMLERAAKLPDWPNSPSNPGHSPVAAAPEPTPTVTDSVAIPALEQASRTLLVLIDMVNARKK